MGYKFDLPEYIKVDMERFVATVEGDLPYKAIFKEMGLVPIDPEIVLNQIIVSFKL